MAVYSLSSKAAADLDGIYEYTILHCGLEQARVYLLGLHERFEMLAEQPTHGRKALEIRQRTAAVFRRRCMVAIDTTGVGPLGMERQALLNPDLMQPGIAEVVLVEKPLTCPKTEVGKIPALGIIGEIHAADMIPTVVLAMNMEPIQVGIAPADRDLNGVMEVGYRAVATDQQSPPDHGANPLNPHL